MNAAEEHMRLGDYDRAEQWLIRGAKATDPYFRPGYMMLVDLNVWSAVRLDRAARWGRAFEAAHTEDWASKLG